MQVENIFNPKRFYFLIRNALWQNQLKILLVTGVVAILVFLLSGMSAIRQIPRNPHVGIFLVFLFTSGFLVSANAFRDLSNDKSAGSWLMLPATTLEKYTSRLFLTSIGYLMGTTMIYFVISVVSELINQMMFGFAHDFFNPFNDVVLKSAAIFIVLQSIFLLGAIYFRRFAFIKTVLFLLLVFLALVFLLIISMKWILGGHFSVLSDGGISALGNILAGEWLTQVKETLKWMLRFLFWVLLAPFCWVTGYFRLKEFEA